MTLTKAHLVEILCEQADFTRKDAKAAVDAFFQELVDTLAQGEPVKLSGFGQFELRDKKERPGRNPKTGVAVTVTERRVINFHASMKLKERVANAIIRNEEHSR
jgi:integration host factor subunit alpha